MVVPSKFVTVASEKLKKQKSICFLKINKLGGADMDLSKATNQQLYEIAKDEGARMKDRYAAAKELQLRNKEKSISYFDEIQVEKDENRWF